MKDIDSSAAPKSPPSDSVDDRLNIDHPEPADLPKMQSDWFDIAGDEDITADHYSRADYSRDEHSQSPTSEDFSYEAEYDIHLSDPPAIANVPICGVFYNTAVGKPAYAGFPPGPFLLIDTSLSYLPETVTVTASTAGLVCCRGHNSRQYYICNPFTEEWTMIPAQTNDHTDNVSIVLIVDGGDYQIICAYPINSGWHRQKNSAIEIFDSRSWKWTASVWNVDAEIVRVSGVAVNAAAYWRTVEGMMVVYVPGVDEVLLSVPPGSCWELGELEGRLCCTSVRGTEAMVSVPVMLYDGVVGWEEKVRFDVGPDWRMVREQDLPLPVRSQGGEELMFWEGLMSRPGRYLVVRNVATWSSRRLSDNPPQPGDDLVPYIISEIRFKKEPEGLLNETIEMQAARLDDTTKEEPEAEEGEKFQS